MRRDPIPSLVLSGILLLALAVPGMLRAGPRIVEPLTAPEGAPLSASPVLEKPVARPLRDLVRAAEEHPDVRVVSGRLLSGGSRPLRGAVAFELRLVVKR